VSDDTVETECDWCHKAFTYVVGSEFEENGIDEHGFHYDALFVECPHCKSFHCVLYAT
jgi:hypothetical protein